VQLKTENACEFVLSQQLYDEDFPGHYCRQIKSVSITFPAVVGPYQNINATLTQLSHETLLAPDEDALLKPDDDPSIVANSLSIRRDWRANQQIALSRGVNDSGLFELRFQDERYLPFEGTGAVSTWRLELEGLDGMVDISTLADVLITVNYTSLQGGDKFAKKVKSLYRTNPNKAFFVNIAQAFPSEWHAFISENSNPDIVEPAPLSVAIAKEAFYNPKTCNEMLMFVEANQGGNSGSGIEMDLNINGNTNHSLKNLVVNTEIETAIRNGAEIVLTPTDGFDAEQIKNIGLVFGYSCKFDFRK
jgi:hypothetical protein